MKIYFVTPIDIKYSYRATEGLIYEIVKYLREEKIDARILVTKLHKHMEVRKDYKKVYEEFKSIPQKDIKCTKINLPLNFEIFFYYNLPKDGIIYLPYNFYNYLLNIATKPKNQKYIIGCHSMHLKKGHILRNYLFLERFMNFLLKKTIFSQKEILNNVYFHVLNNDQEKYLLKFGIKKENIFKIPNFIDWKMFKFKQKSGKKLKVLHIGGKQKDSLIVSNVIENLYKRNKVNLFEFYFVGKEQPQTLIKLAQRNRNVHLINELSEGEKIKLLANMDVMILPSVETFCRTLLEGMASGLIIVSGELNPIAIEMSKLSDGVEIAHSIEEYSNILLKIAHMKNKVEFDNYRAKNREIAKNFDRSIVLPLFKKKFIELLYKAKT